MAGFSALDSEADSLSQAAVAGLISPAAGEHPRLFFRKADVPKLRQRAATPEGKAIIARCIKLLDGAQSVREPGKFSLWDGAAFGFLYQITGDKKYADLARGSVDIVWAGASDRDKRYSLMPPDEPMRAGPSLSAVAMAYDLCYDGWEPAYRAEQAQKMMTWKAKCKKRGGDVSLEQLSTRPDNPNPISNHYGLQVGGAGLTLLALKGDPGVDNAKIEQWLAGQEKCARKVLTEDFGQTGYFFEHAGPGVIAMTWTFTPWLLAERVAAGRDWIAASPTAEWMSLRFVMQTIPTDKGAQYTNPVNGGGYGSQMLVQNGGHHATYFSMGFGAIRPEHRPAMLWVYNNFVQPAEAKIYPAEVAAGEKTFDVYLYPHRALFALVNWPFDTAPENPEKTLPKAVGDPLMGQYIFRNRWQDAEDTIVSVLFGARTADRDARRCMVWGLKDQLVFGNVAPSVVPRGKLNTAKVDLFEPRADGSGVVSAGGNAVGVDFSKASGADAVVVMVGPGATGCKPGARSKVANVIAGPTTFSILTLSSGAHPEPKAEGEKVVLGGQTISFDGKKIVFGKASAFLKP